MKLRTKITIVVMILMFVVISTVSFITYNKSNKIVVSQSESAIGDLTLATVNLMNSIVDKESGRVKDVAGWADVRDLLLQHDSNDETNAELVMGVNEQLSFYIKQNSNIESSYIVDKFGRIMADSSIALVGRNISNEESFKNASKSNKLFISNITRSQSTGENIIEFIYPVEINGAVRGYVCNTVISKTLLQPIENMKILGTKSGYAYVVDKSGIMVYHPTMDKIGKKVENAVVSSLVEKLQFGEEVTSDVIQYDFNGVMKFAAYDFVPVTNWILVLTADIKEVQKPVDQMAEFVLILGIASSLIACILIFLLIFYLTMPLIKITALVNKTADFNLVYDKSFEVFMKRRDETGLIAKALVNMRVVLTDMAMNLKKTSALITANSDKVFELTEKMSLSSQDNSATTQQLSAGMEETAASSEEITSAVDEMEGRVKLIVNKTEDGAKVCEEISERAENIKDNANNSINNAKSIYNDTKAKMEVALEETKSIQQINALADSILGITKQTNLLALNAAIEAARAGEAGKGFAVVADQIRSLAELSSKTASDIQRIVGTVNTSVENINYSSEQMLEFVDKTVLKDYDNLISISEQYNNDANTVNEIIGTFNATAQDLSITIENISTAIREVVKTVYESTQGVTDIAAKTTEIVYSSQEVEDTARENTASAKSLESIVSTFKME